MDNFAYWLKNELSERRWKQADLMRHTGLSPSAISKIMNSKVANPAQPVFIAIAEALGLPSEFVFQKAGYLPPERVEDEVERAILYELEDVPLVVKQEVLEYIKFKKAFIARYK